MIIAVYVDDLILVCNDLELLKTTKESLNASFDMRDLGELHYFLGIQVMRDRANKTISLSQSTYVETVLKRFGMQECKPVKTPMMVNEKLSKEMSSTTEEEKNKVHKNLYQCVLGCLTYLSTGTRPDIAEAVRVASQFMAIPGEQHFQAVKRISTCVVQNIGAWCTNRSIHRRSEWLGRSTKFDF